MGAIGRSVCLKSFSNDVSLALGVGTIMLDSSGSLNAQRKLSFVCVSLLSSAVVCVVFVNSTVDFICMAFRKAQYTHFAWFRFLLTLIVVTIAMDIREHLVVVT